MEDSSPLPELHAPPAITLRSTISHVHYTIQTMTHHLLLPRSGCRTARPECAQFLSSLNNTSISLIGSTVSNESTTAAARVIRRPRPTPAQPPPPGMPTNRKLQLYLNYHVIYPMKTKPELQIILYT